MFFYHHLARRIVFFNSQSVSFKKEHFNITVNPFKTKYINNKTKTKKLFIKMRIKNKNLYRAETSDIHELKNNNFNENKNTKVVDPRAISLHTYT